ncbi:Tn3 family transposase, partial [Nocardiopsis dassonvillei]
MAVGDSSDLGNGALVGVRGRARFSELEWLRTEPDRVSESRHALARKICFGNRGELRQRYRQGLEDRLGAPGLVLNAVVGWNSLYIDAALTRLRSGGWRRCAPACPRWGSTTSTSWAPLPSPPTPPSRSCAPCGIYTWSRPRTVQLRCRSD